MHSIAKIVLNAYLLYFENSNRGKKKITRLQFHSCIIETISNEWIEKRNDIYHRICDVNNKEQYNPVYSVKLLPVKLERNCLVCHNPQQRKIIVNCLCNLGDRQDVQDYISALNKQTLLKWSDK